jgi:hypothetical protein
MSTWTPQRGVLLYRPRLGPSSRPLPAHEPPFPWLTLPLMGLGFALFFAGLALIGVDGRAWEAALAGAGAALVVLAFVLLVRRFR